MSTPLSFPIPANDSPCWGRSITLGLLLLLLVLPAAAQSQLSIRSSGTLTIPSGALRLGGDFVNNGTFDATSGTVTFIGAADQTFTPGAGATIQKIVVDQASANTVLLANSLSVTDSVAVRSGDLDLNGQQIDLGNTGVLDETDGHTVTGTSGTITATRFLNAPNAVNVAGLGARITSSVNMSATTVTRGHAPQTGSTSNESIARYYDIQPSVNSGLDATLEFFYDDSELNGLDENGLELWRSDDGGSSYAKAGGAVTPSVNVVVLSGIDAFSRWTAASSSAPLPVELANFEARQTEAGVALIWKTLSETNSATFEIQRATSSLQAASELNWTTVGEIDAAGTTEQPHTYRFTDAQIPYTAETLQYRLKQIDLDGTAAYEGDVEIVLGKPQTFDLRGNFPNPFHQTTTIRYTLPQPATVQLAVYDMLGRRVMTLVNERQMAGRKEIRFDAAGLPSGTYFYRLRADEQIETRRLTIVR